MAGIGYFLLLLIPGHSSQSPSIYEKTKDKGSRGTGLSSSTRKKMALEGETLIICTSIQKITQYTSGEVFPFLTLSDCTNK